MVSACQGYEASSLSVLGRWLKNWGGVVKGHRIRVGSGYNQSYGSGRARPLGAPGPGCHVLHARYAIDIYIYIYIYIYMGASPKGSNM